MTVIRRSAKKGAKAYLSVKGAKQAGKAARKTAKGWAVTKLVTKLAPGRLLAALGAMAAAGLAAAFAKRRAGSEPAATHTYTPAPGAQGTNEADPDQSAQRYVETQQTGT
jgi:hypothetical protein